MFSETERCDSQPRRALGAQLIEGCCGLFQSLLSRSESHQVGLYLLAVLFEPPREPGEIVSGLFLWSSGPWACDLEVVVLLVSTGPG